MAAARRDVLLHFAPLLGLVGAVLGTAEPARAQSLMTAPIGFRSGLTEGAVTTRPGTLTVDAGSSVRSAGPTTTWRVGELNIRAPLSGRLEARLYANAYAWRRSPAGVASGREDLALAMAAMLVGYRGWRPVTTVIVRLETPTGSLPGRGRAWRPGARLVMGWELPGRVALHTNLGRSTETSGGRQFDRELASVWLARRLAGPIGMYAEVLGATREQPGGRAAGYLHGGVTVLVTPSIHLDLHGGLGSGSAGAPRWFGVGMRQRVGL
jgi:hypothetical protein